uniref:Polynucleotide 5'-hydroxyl-kinase NOL9 n=1 Tax=Mola mola TaxID=94237 RepID=A0A3Q3X3F4_MOLML
MKVKKHTQVKGHAKSHKWKDVRGKRCRPPITSSELSPSPALAKMIREHQVSLKKKPTVKRLKNKAKSVADTKRNSPQSASKKPHTQPNGNSACTIDDSDDSEDWREYSLSVHGNCTEASGDPEEVRPGRLEGDALHHCAERDDRRNCAVMVISFFVAVLQSLCFRGKCFLTCLYGRVEVMGFTIEEGQESYPLFSPASHCPLTIRALETSASRKKKLLKRIVSDSSIVLLEPMETPLTRFLSSFKELSELFSSPMCGMIKFVWGGMVKGLKHLKTRREALLYLLLIIGLSLTGDMDGCAVIFVCGPKNVGKSTFIRTLINTLLNHTTGVDYLEGDLGQTEFTPAGCLSLLTVKEPLLGPPFTHQCTPEHMIYYGQSSCESDLDRYLDSLKFVWRRRSQGRETPVIINTMGWVKGQLSLHSLLVDMIRFFPVSHVVQLGHSGITQCPALTPDFLRAAQEPQSPKELHPPYRTVRRSNEQRELSLLAYLSRVQSPDPGPVRPLHSLTPYQVPHTAVALGVVHCEVVPSHIFYAANACLVGLCCLAEKVTSKGGPVLLSQAPICPCVGFGTCERSNLCVVNCLLLGAISLPHCILTSQPSFEGEMPYVTTDYSFDLSGAGKLRVFKGLTRPSQTGVQ